MRANQTELPGRERGGMGGLGQGRDRWARAGPGLEGTDTRLEGGAGGFCYKPVKEKGEGPRCRQLGGNGEPADAVTGAEEA